MEYEYTLECSVCESVVTLIIEDNEEKPTHCPMCGSITTNEWDD